MLSRIKLYTLEGWLFTFFFLSLLTNAKYRLGDKSFFHFGGAELAISPFDIPFILIIAVIFYRLLIGSFVLKKDIFNTLSFVYIACLFPSVILSIDPLYAMLEFVREIKLLIVFLWLRMFFSNSEGRKYFYYAVVVAILFQGLLSISQFSTGQTVSFISDKATDLNLISGGIVRVAGSFGHPGLLAQYINITLSSMLVVWLASNKKGFKNFYIVAFIVGLFVVIMTFSRTALAIQVLLLFFIFYFSNKFIKWNFSMGKKIFLFLVVITLTMIVFVLFSDQILNRFNTASAESTSTRLVLANIALKMIIENPIAGIGLNNFVLAMPSYDETGLHTYWKHPVHNIYLLVASESGLVAALFFIIKLFVFIYAPLSVMRKESITVEHRAFVFSGCCGLIAIMFSGLLGWSWRLDSIHGVYWIVLAMLASVKSSLKGFNK